MTTENVAEERPRSSELSRVGRTASPIVAAAIPVLLYLAYVAHYAVDIPSSDDWNMVQLASEAIHHQLGFSRLWWQYGNTRLFTGNVLFAAAGRVDHLNEKHIILLAAAVYIAAFVFLLLLLRSYLQRALTFLPVLMLGVVWFSVADVENSLWSFQVAWYLVVFFFVAMVYFLSNRRKHLNILFALSIVVAVLASITEVQGFAVWAVGLICIAWASPWGRRTYYEAGIWGSAGLVTAAMYFHNFRLGDSAKVCVIEGGTAEGCSLSHGLSHPVELARFLAVLAGNVFTTVQGSHVLRHELLGAVIWIAAGFVVVQSIRERRLGISPLPVLLITFALQFDLMLALSRLGQGAIGAGKNWYTMPNFILLSGIVVYASRHIPDLRRAREPGKRRGWLSEVAFGILIAFLVVQVAVSTNFGISYGRAHRARNVLTAQVIVALPLIPDAKRNCYFMNVVAGPPIETLYFLLSLAQADRLTLFHGSGAERYRTSHLPRIEACEKQ
jgi:ABC-2 type transport system permease protein